MLFTEAVCPRYQTIVFAKAQKVTTSLDLKKLKTTLTKSEKLTFVTIFENHTMAFLEFMKLVPTHNSYSYIQQVIAITFA